jgi:hypothetical protein
MVARTLLNVNVTRVNFFCICVKLFKQFSDTDYLLKMNINYEEVNCPNCLEVKLILMLRVFFPHHIQKRILNFKS